MDKELNNKPATKAAVPGTVDADLTGCMAMAFIHLCNNGLVPRPDDYDTILSCACFWQERRLDPSSHIVAGLASSLPGRIAPAFGTHYISNLKDAASPDAATAVSMAVFMLLPTTCYDERGLRSNVEPDKLRRFVLEGDESCRYWACESSRTVTGNKGV